MDEFGSSLCWKWIVFLFSVGNMLSVNVKFCVKLWKSATETYNLLKKVYGDECLSHTQVHPVHQGKRKHGRVNPNLEQWSFFSISEGLFTWIGCLKVRLLTRSTTRRFWQTFMNGCEEEDLKCGRTAHGFFTKTMCRHTTPRLARRFWRSTRSPWWNIHHTHLT